MADVTSDWQDQGLVAYVNVDRDSASRLGVTMSDVDNALYNAFGQRLISTIYTRANQYRVVLEHDVSATPGLAALNEIRLSGNDGAVVPLSAIAKIEERFGPLSSTISISSRRPPFRSTSPTATRSARRWTRSPGRKNLNMLQGHHHNSGATTPSVRRSAARCG